MTCSNSNDDGPEASPDPIERSVERVASGVATCLADASALDRTLDRLRAAHLRGEPVQADLEAVFDRVPALKTLAALERDDRLASTLEAAVTRNHLTEETGRRFREWWADKRWIAAGVDAHEQVEASRPRSAWDATAIDASVVDGDLIVEHVARKGVDERHRFRVPVSEFVLEGAWRVRAALDPLEAAHGDGSVTLDEEDRARLADARAEIHDALNRLETITDSDVEQSTSDSDSDTDSNSDTDTSPTMASDSASDSDSDTDSNSDTDTSPTMASDSTSDSDSSPVADSVSDSNAAFDTGERGESDDRPEVVLDDLEESDGAGPDDHLDAS